MSRGLCIPGFSAWDPPFSRQDVCRICLVEHGRCVENESDPESNPNKEKRRKEMIKSLGLRKYNWWKP